MKTSIDELINEIIASLQNIANTQDHQSQGKRAQSESVKTAIAQLGRNRRLEIYAHGVHSSVEVAWHEWLWDLVWAEQRQVEGSAYAMVERLVMVAEIEWNTSNEEIAVDFQKLVFAVADLKVYVFRKTSESRNREIAHFCRILADIQGSPRIGRYLLVGMPETGQKEVPFFEVW